METELPGKRKRWRPKRRFLDVVEEDMGKVGAREMDMEIELSRQCGRVVKAPSCCSKPTRAILLCPWERHFYGTFPCLVSWKAALNYNHISIKLQADSNILVSPKSGRGNCLLYVLAPPSFSC